MRTSTFLISTVKETPADAEIISHKLMIRAGMIRKLATGIYNWLPLGLRVLRKVEAIVRDEMNKAGAMEVLMPAVQPAELWEESGRWEQYGPELLRITDRHDRSFCFGPTHEEVITDLARNEIRSYKQLPATFYQIQMKFRDEVRPRFGVMRAREFLMKDAYSFHLDQASLEETYKVMHTAYTNIFTRCGLDFRPVRADSGNIGGALSHEFHVLASSGEDAIAFSDASDFAANVEAAEALAPQTDRPAKLDEMQKVATPGQHTIEDVSKFLKVDPSTTIKTLIVEGSNGQPVALVLRGDHELNEIKAEKLEPVASPLTMASEEAVKKATGSKPGSVGPVDLNITVIADHSAAALYNFICGANEDDHHLTGANWERDVPAPQTADIRNVQDGDPSPDGKGRLHIKRGIEVGHIFQLGTKYSEAMKATVQNEQSKNSVMTMGCYGIGVSRVVAAAIEQNHDDKGIIWPDPIAPFQIGLLPMNMHKSQRLKEAVDKLYDELVTEGFDILLDDRPVRPGPMFADLELIGVPHRLVLSDSGLDEGQIEYRHRRDTENQKIPLDQLIEFLKEKLS